jgi:predicted adenine nucleotide alpha hydrolase (AANH) superfamily ATPase
MIIDNYLALTEYLNKPNQIKPKLLLHACCAPCSSYVLEYLKDAFDITIYFYNPNIDSEEEYNKRYDDFQKLGDYKIIKANYVPKAFEDISRGLENVPEGGIRCWGCYEERLESTAIFANQNGFDYFTTTLSISPYKNANKINEIGQNLSNIYDVKFLYSNFKKNDGYKKSILLSKQLGLYRQDYCGCQFSINERELKKSS